MDTDSVIGGVSDEHPNTTATNETDTDTDDNDNSVMTMNGNIHTPMGSPFEPTHRTKPNHMQSESAATKSESVQTNIIQRNDPTTNDSRNCEEEDEKKEEVYIECNLKNREHVQSQNRDTICAPTNPPLKAPPQPKRSHPKQEMDDTDDEDDDLNHNNNNIKQETDARMHRDIHNDEDAAESQLSAMSEMIKITKKQLLSNVFFARIVYADVSFHALQRLHCDVQAFAMYLFRMIEFLCV
eukprot:13007_1